MKEDKYKIRSKEEYLSYLKQDREMLLHSFSLPMDGKIRPKLLPRCELDYIYKYQYKLRTLEYHLNCKSKGFFSRLYNKMLTYFFFRRQVKTGMFLQPNCFGPGLAIKHIGPMIISGGVRIGKNCRIHPGTNIGVDGRNKKVGTMGDDLFLGNGCKIIGEVTLGNCVVVGAGAVVTKSFEEDGIVLAGVPAKIVSRGGDFRYF